MRSPLLLALVLAACAGDPAPSGGSSGGGAGPREASARWTVGTSVLGRPIVAERFGAGPRVLLMSAIHGNERPAVILGERLRSSLLAGLATSRGVQVVLLPVANPDGVAAASRHNAHGIDLNRNFDAANFAPSKDHGQAPLQEPESAAVAALVESLDPVLIISVHNPLDQVDWNGPADGIARLMADASGIPLEPPLGGLPGSLGSWAGEDLGIPTITLELPHSIPDLGGYDAGLVAVRAALDWASSRASAGPWEPEEAADSPWRGEVLATSAGGLPILLERRGEAPRRVLVVGGADGGDQTAFIAERVRASLLLAAEAPPAAVVIITVPNPDGLATGSGSNADKQPVETGFAPPEAPETAALDALLREGWEAVVVIEAAGETGAVIEGSVDLEAAVQRAGLPLRSTPPKTGTLAARALELGPVVRLLVPPWTGTEGQAQPYAHAVHEVINTEAP
ncbi:MAG: hypothetical protein AMXMBFR64_03360 [Myxococcales bacterium]